MGPDTFKHPGGSSERLNPYNYPSWKPSMMWILRGAHLWKLVTGEDTLPPLPSEDAPEEDRQSITAARDAWEHRAAQGCLMIYMSLTESIRVFVHNDMEPAAMWNTLATHYDEAWTAAGQHRILMKIHRCVAEPDEPIEKYFAKMFRLRNQLRGTAGEISDQLFQGHLRWNLPAKFKLTASLHKSNPDATAFSLMCAIIEDERFYNEISSRRANDHANGLRNRKRSRVDGN